MDIGISSSCFYPTLVEDSLRKVGELGAKTAEVFMNSPCELEGNILKELCTIREYYSINVRSIHPFTSAYETIMIFSDYDRRTCDSIEFYKKYFYAAAQLGAEMIVLHGGKSAIPTVPEKYAAAYVKLSEAARSEGIYIAHENVKEHHCSDPDFMKKVADIAGDDFRMVLDIKQCRRSGKSEYDFMRLLGSKIAQVHISDTSRQHDCLPPGKGEYDFGKLFCELKKVGYDESAVIELYNSNYSDDDELKNSRLFLENVLSSEKV